MQLKSPQQITYSSLKSITVSIYNTIGIICGYSLKEQKLVIAILSPNLTRIDKTKCYIDENYIDLHELILVPIHYINPYIK